MQAVPSEVSYLSRVQSRQRWIAQAPEEVELPEEAVLGKCAAVCILCSYSAGPICVNALKGLALRAGHYGEIALVSSRRLHSTLPQRRHFQFRAGCCGTFLTPSVM